MAGQVRGLGEEESFRDMDRKGEGKGRDRWVADLGRGRDGGKELREGVRQAREEKGGRDRGKPSLGIIQEKIPLFRDITFGCKFTKDRSNTRKRVRVLL